MKLLSGVALLVAACGGQAAVDESSRGNPSLGSPGAENDAGVDSEGPAEQSTPDKPPNNKPDSDTDAGAAPQDPEEPSNGGAGGGAATGGVGGVPAPMGGSASQGGAGGSSAGSPSGGATTEPPDPPCPDSDDDGVCDDEDVCSLGSDADEDENGYPDGCEKTLWSQSLESKRREAPLESPPQGAQFSLSVAVPNANGVVSSCYQQYFGLPENERGNVTHELVGHQIDCIMSPKRPKEWWGAVFPHGIMPPPTEPDFTTPSETPTHAVVIVSKNVVEREGSKVIATEFSATFELRIRYLLKIPPGAAPKN